MALCQFGEAAQTFGSGWFGACDTTQPVTQGAPCPPECADWVLDDDVEEPLTVQPAGPCP